MTTPPHKNSSKNKITIKNNSFWKHGEIHFILFLLLLALLIKLLFYKEFLLFFNCCNHFNMLRQIIIPLSFGAIGGYSYVIMSSLTSTYNTGIPHARKKFTFIGSIAGIAAVNLLNPSGSVSQVMILSLIAGLSGISYLKRNALVDSQHEDSILDKEKLHRPRPSLNSEQIEQQKESPINKELTKSQLLLKVLEEQKNK